MMLVDNTKQHRFPTTHSFTLKSNADAKIQPFKRIRVSLHKKTHNKIRLRYLESCKIITKVDAPTEWVNALVIVEKSN